MERKAILRGFLDYRALLAGVGIVDGFQWVGGSFLENKEKRENLPPKDLDVVMFYRGSPASNAAAAALGDPRAYHLDFYPIDLAYVAIGYDPVMVGIDNARYWVGLFSHRRDGIWKGMVRVELNTPADDAAARLLLA